MGSPDDSISFDGEVVLITGAGRGIGRCHALLFGQRGAHVVVNDIDPDVCTEVADEIISAGGTATPAPGDVVDDADAVVSVALDEGGCLDVLVNNAGIAHVAPFSRQTVRDVERLVRVHAVGTAAMTASAWDALTESRGRVVNTTSAAVLGLIGSTAYAAAKGAVLGFTRSLAIEAAAVGVRVNAVMPMARTRMYEQSGGEPGSQEDALLTAHFPPELIAPVAVYLAWRDVPHNGQIVEVSGGTSAFVNFAVTPYVAAATPEAARDALASASGEVTVVGDLAGMLTAKMALATG